MKKIIVIGCPGGGKSTMVFKMKEILHYPVLHLDKIYHIDNEKHITRDELRNFFTDFAVSNQNCIIDGNYISTLEDRIKLVDTIIMLDIPGEVCAKNAIERSKKEKTSDMADGFDNSKLKDGFIDFILNFEKETKPIIMELLKKYEKEKNIIILKSYSEIDNFIENLKK